jgi:hypothetical protein
MIDAKKACEVAAEHMCSGRMHLGWPLLERRFEAFPPATFPPAHIPIWRGEPLNGKRLMIWPEQGFGDRIQFARFVPELRARGAEVVIVDNRPLERLFKANLDAEFVLEADAAGIAADYAIFICSLPDRLGVTLENLPGKPYISATPRPSAHRVGLVTHGDPRQAKDKYRSLSKLDATHLRAALGDPLSLHQESTRAKDFQETAEIIAGLDLVISVCTSVAHLAGAMGKPTWVMLAHNADWRWMRDRLDSPWYPSVRLFRQTRKGDWKPVIKAVAEAYHARKALQLAPLRPAQPDLVLPPGATWTPRL